MILASRIRTDLYVGCRCNASSRTGRDKSPPNAINENNQEEIPEAVEESEYA